MEIVFQFSCLQRRKLGKVEGFFWLRNDYFVQDVLEFMFIVCFYANFLSWKIDVKKNCGNVKVGNFMKNNGKFDRKSGNWGKTLDKSWKIVKSGKFGWKVGKLWKSIKNYHIKENLKKSPENLNEKFGKLIKNSRKIMENYPVREI